ncbi:MAG: YDG domain-containing protein [Pseudomonadota bacterium]
MTAKSTRLRLALSTTLASGLLFVAAPAWAQGLPDTGNVTNVNAGLGGAVPTTPVYTPTPTPTGTNLQVDLRNNRTILNWGGTGFAIAAGNSVNFKDARATTGVTNRTDNIAVLNRDLSGGPSLIFGNLNADPNVSVYILNRSGVTFGGASAVDVGGLFAIAGNITNDNDFLNGNTTQRFSNSLDGGIVVAPGAKFTTHASASSDGGRVGDFVFVGSRINFNGAGGAALTANVGGDAGLIAATDVTIVNAPGSPLSFTINRGSAFLGGSDAITVTGNVTARNVTMASARIGSISGDPRINISGTITATGAAGTDRGVVLTAGAAAPGVAYGSPPASGAGANVSNTGSIRQAGKIVSASGIWINAADGTSGDGSLTATGLIDIAGGSFAAGGVYNEFSANAAVTGGSIAVHTQALFKGNVKTTSGNLTLDSAASLPFATSFLGTLSVAGSMTGNAYGLSVTDATVGGAIDITTTRDQFWDGHTTATSFRGVSTNGSLVAPNIVASAGGIYARAFETVDLDYASATTTIDAGSGHTLAIDEGYAVDGIKLTGGTEVFVKKIVTTGANSDIEIQGWLRSAPTLVSAARDISIALPSSNASLLGTVIAGRNVTVTGSAFGVGGSASAELIKATSGSATLGGTLGINQLVTGLGATFTGANFSVNQAQIGGDFIINASSSGVSPFPGTVVVRDTVVGGNLQISNTAQLTLGGSITAGGAISATTTGELIFGGTLVQANGEIYAKGASMRSGSVTIQSNADGIGTESLTLETPGRVELAESKLMGGPARQSDVRLRFDSYPFPLNFGAISARSLQGASGSGAFSNNFTIAGGISFAGSVNLIDSLTLTAPQLAALNIAITGGNLDLRIGNATTITGAWSASGDVKLALGAGNLTIGASGSVNGVNVVLSTPAAFRNLAGSAAVTASGHWVIYSANPAGNTFGNLNSGNTALWNSTLATRAPETVTGNRYVFSFAPTLTFTTVDFSKVYGTDLNGANGAVLYAITGYRPGVAGAFLGDTAATAFSGSPLVTSAGLDPRASVAGGPYATAVGQGSLASAAGYGFAFSNPGSKITVTPKPITGIYAVDTRTYDGTTAATGSVALSGVVAGDIVGTTGVSFAFANKNAGLGKLVNVTGTASLTGADSANYSFTPPSGSTTTGNILQKALTGTVNANSKTYDGTTSATGSVTVSGAIAGDDVSASGFVLSFADKNAGIAKLVSVAGTLWGADAGNYTLGGLSGSADILKKALSGTATANSKTYDGTRSGSGSVALSGVISGDAIGTTGTVFTFADKNAGAGKTVAVTGTALSGADAGNYTLTLSATATADIFKKALTGTVTANSRTYDGTAGATGSIALSGVVTGDDVGTTGAVLAFADKNAGTGKTVTATGAALSGADAGNYTLGSIANGLADILKKALSGTITVNGKTYDGTRAGTGSIALSGVVSGDNVGTTGSVFTFADKNAGTGKTVAVTGTALSGSDSANYTLTLAGTATADILKKALTGTIAANSKTYDGNAGATGTLTLSGIVAGDDVGATGTTLAFADKNAGTGKTVTASGTTLSGADAGNYTLSVGNGLADILKKALTGTVTANSKTYDGTTAATGTVSVSGVIAGDDVSASGFVLSFADKNAGIAKLVSVAGTLWGADAGNYTLGGLSGSADILKKALSGTVTANSKTYDGTRNGSGSIALSGVISGDAVGTSGSVFTFADKNAGMGKTVAVTGTTLSGADAGNYTLALSATATADILKKALTGNGTVTGKTYDGTTAATGGTLTLSGVIAGDDVGTTGSAFAFADKNAGTGKAVNVTGTTLTGADAANYTLSAIVAVGDIFKKAIAGTVTANNKTYDGTTTGSGTVSLSGVIAGDSVGTTGSVFTFASKNAGAGKTVTVTGTTLNGVDGGNYTLSLPASALADILRKSITGSITVTSRQYDGTTAGSGAITLNGVVSGDAVGTAGTIFTFSDRNVGSGKTVTVSGTALSGADAGNYTLAPLPATAIGEILKRVIAVAADNKSKTNGEDDPLLTFTITSGSLVSGDGFSGLLARAPGENPGTYAISIGALSAGGNYQLNFTPGLFTIEINPATQVPQTLKTIPLPLPVPPQQLSDSLVTIDKDALCGEDKACVAR